MTGFLRKVKAQVNQMADKSEISLDDIAHIIQAFGLSGIPTNKLERFVLRNFLKLTPKQSA